MPSAKCFRQKVRAPSRGVYRPKPSPAPARKRDSDGGRWGAVHHVEPELDMYEILAAGPLPPAPPRERDSGERTMGGHMSASMGRHSRKISLQDLYPRCPPSRRGNVTAITDDRGVQLTGSTSKIIAASPAPPSADLTRRSRVSRGG